MRERPRPRITREQIAEIRQLRRDGRKLREIAIRLGISINSACRHGKTPRAYNRCVTAEIQPVAALIPPLSRARLMAGR
jgi:hypothetical protein